MDKVEDRGGFWIECLALMLACALQVSALVSFLHEQGATGCDAAAGRACAPALRR